jgi:Cytochrome P460
MRMTTIKALCMTASAKANVPTARPAENVTAFAPTLASVLAIVFALAMFGCSIDEPKITATTNQIASLVGELPANPLQWKIITAALNREDSTMSTLYGNDAAVQYARTHSQHNYPSGAVLSLVTWTQQDDPRYFGAKTPAQVKSVEFVTVAAGPDGSTSYAYERYEGTPLMMSTTEQSLTPSARAAYLLAQRAAVMP